MILTCLKSNIFHYRTFCTKLAFLFGSSPLFAHQLKYTQVVLFMYRK